MGIFTGQIMDMTRNYGAPLAVNEAEGYGDGVYSAQIAQIVGLQNEMALVEAGIYSDMQACMMVSEGYNEDEVLSFSESVLGDMFNKIKEFFKKLWAKIKAIFTGFMARLEAKFGKNNKEFINKYKKEVIGKDLTDFEVKFRKRKDNGAKTLNEFDLPDNTEAKHLDAAKIAKDWDQNKSDYENFDSEKFEEETYKKACGTACTSKEFEKEAFDFCFEDEELTEVKTGDISKIMTDMIGFKDSRKNLKKELDGLEKTMRECIKSIEKEQSAVYKLAPGNEGDKEEYRNFKVSWNNNASSKRGDKEKYVATGTSSNYEGDEDNEKAKYHKIDAGASNNSNRGTAVSNYQKALGHISKVAHIIQSCALKYSAVALKIEDFDNKQNRMIFARAVAYKRKEESAIMEEAMAELAVWEADY